MSGWNSAGRLGVAVAAAYQMVMEEVRMDSRMEV